MNITLLMTEKNSPSSEGFSDTRLRTMMVYCAGVSESTDTQTNSEETFEMASRASVSSESFFQEGRCRLHRFWESYPVSL